MTRVAELVVITRPMSQVGWARACSGVTSRHLLPGPAAERTAAGGQDQPVDLGRAAAAQALGECGVLGVDRHELALAGGADHQRTADHQRFLVGQRQHAARRQGRQRRRQAGRAGDRVEDHVAAQPGHLGGGVRARHDPRQPGPGRTPSRGAAPPRTGRAGGPAPRSPGSPRRRGPGCPAPAGPAARSGRRPRPARPPGTRSGRSAMTSRAWVPMDPVLPRITTSRTRPVSQARSHRAHFHIRTHSADLHPLLRVSVRTKGCGCLGMAAGVVHRLARCPAQTRRTVLCSGHDPDPAEPRVRGGRLPPRRADTDDPRKELVHIRRGAYAEPTAEEPDPRAAHRQLVEATIRQSSPEAVASYISAAVLHGLPTWNDSLSRVHLSRDRSGGGRRGAATPRSMGRHCPNGMWSLSTASGSRAWPYGRRSGVCAADGPRGGRR